MPALHSVVLGDAANPARPRHLAYYEWGDTANPRVAVCIHGLTRNARDFDFLAAALADNYRVLCIDIAGRGKSDWLNNKTDYNYATYIADTCAFFDQLSLKHVDFIGTSMGGIIGMMLAAQKPDFIGRLVLNDIGAVVSGAGLKRILNYVGASSVFANAQDAMAHLKSILAPFGISSQAQWEQMFKASLTPLPDGRYALAYDPDISQPFKESASNASEVADIDLTAFWQLVTCPALILRGGDSDILARATAQEMCKRAAPTKLVEFEGVGHAPALLDDAQIRVIADWLDNAP